jgi:hypothetical protein
MPDVSVIASVDLPMMFPINKVAVPPGWYFCFGGIDT